MGSLLTAPGRMYGAAKTVSRVYANACVDRPAEYSEYDLLNLEWGSIATTG